MVDKRVAFLLLLAVLVAAAPPQGPIIGIYTQTDSGDEPKQTGGINELLTSNYSYIAASYVKYIQMSGAQVVPIFAYSNTSYLDALLPKLNGVLFPGGGTAINIGNKWTANADHILKYAMAENKKGNPFAVWGTCLGMQLVTYLTSGYDGKWLSPVTGQSGVVNKLALKNPSYLYDNLSDDLKTQLSTGKGLVYFNHVWAVSLAYFQSNPKLTSFWNIASTTTSSGGLLFVSSLQAKEYPFYVSQFHPEKNLFEWKVNADRSQSGVEIVQILSNKFVEKARQSQNRWTDDADLRKQLIYNYKTQGSTSSFTQIYLFHEVQQTDPAPPLPSLQTE